jgi:acyl dehydratase
MPDKTGTQLITRHDIRHFAVAIGAMSPVHHDVAVARSRGYRDLLAPAFFFTTLGLSLGRVMPATRLREDGIPLDDELGGRVVAGETTVEWFGDIVAGDEVEVHQSFTGSYTKVGRNGPQTIFEYTRTYTVAGCQVVVERISRIGR